MALEANSSKDDGHDPQRVKEPLNATRITLPVEFYKLPMAMAFGGAMLGGVRGGRREGMRFLAENAHRAPTTRKGWYLYRKTKNYRMMLGGLRGGGKDGLKLGLTGLAWAGLAEVMRRTGLDDVREIVAGVGTGSVFAAIYRLPWTKTRQTLGLGLLVGTSMRLGRYTMDKAKEAASTQQRGDLAEN